MSLNTRITNLAGAPPTVISVVIDHKLGYELNCGSYPIFSCSSSDKAS